MNSTDTAMDNSGEKVPTMESGGSSMNGSSSMSGGRRNTRRNNMMRKRNTRRNNMMRKRNTRRNNTMMGGGYKMTTGSAVQVWNGTAKHTSGGLTKKDLMRHKGRIVSKKKHAAGLKAIKRLRAAGYVAKKGTFKLFKKQK
jgi:hypothetical protein